MAELLKPMAEAAKGRAIVAVCDIARNTAVGRRERAAAGVIVIYCDGRETARSHDADHTINSGFAAELKRLGLSM